MGEYPKRSEIFAGDEGIDRARELINNIKIQSIKLKSKLIECCIKKTSVI